MDAAPLKTKTARSETLGVAFRATGIRRCNHLNTFKYTPQKKNPFTILLRPRNFRQNFVLWQEF